MAGLQHLIGGCGYPTNCGDEGALLARTKLQKKLSKSVIPTNNLWFFFGCCGGFFRSSLQKKKLSLFVQLTQQEGKITLISTAVSHTNLEMKPFILEQYLPSEPIVAIDVHLCLVLFPSVEPRLRCWRISILCTKQQVDPIVISMEPFSSEPP